MSDMREFEQYYGDSPKGNSYFAALNAWNHQQAHIDALTAENARLQARVAELREAVIAIDAMEGKQS